MTKIMRPRPQKYNGGKPHILRLGYEIKKQGDKPCSWCHKKIKHKDQYMNYNSNWGGYSFFVHIECYGKMLKVAKQSLAKEIRRYK